MTIVTQKRSGAVESIREGEAPLLEIDGLCVEYQSDGSALKAVDEVSLVLRTGRTLGVVGESGCGKSTIALAILNLVQAPGRITAGSIRYRGDDILTMPDHAVQGIRGNRIAMIFQEPMTALNPVYSIGDQIAEVFQIHEGMPRDQAMERAVAALEEVQIPDPASRVNAYPHQLSGGMRQRAMIAMALACKPDILIADEATTALDVTIQAQILDLIQALQDQHRMSIIFISHNLGVVSEIADDVMVMYAGRIVETAPSDDLFNDPRHPYTQGLLDTLPRPDRRGRRLPTIAGSVPDLRQVTPGCRFAPRCLISDQHCENAVPALSGLDHRTACFNASTDVS